MIYPKKSPIRGGHAGKGSLWGFGTATRSSALLRYGITRVVGRGNWGGGQG